MKFSRASIIRNAMFLPGILAVPLFVAAWGIAHAEAPSSARSTAAYERNVADITAALEDKDLQLGARVFLQITKQPAQLTAFVLVEDGTYDPFKSWDICSYSGGLGPKHQQGDGKSPEGFYNVPAGSMNPWSSYHLSFNLGYPNAFDRAHGRTGNYLMVHGNCVSIGCYAMTDDGIEEIWTLLQAAYESGQSSVPVHIYPFEMTAANLQRYSAHKEAPFWRSLAPGWVAFETTGKVPKVRVENKAYLVEPTY